MSSQQKAARGWAAESRSCVNFTTIWVGGNELIPAALFIRLITALGRREVA